MLDSNVFTVNEKLAHYEGDVLLVPCKGQGSVNDFDPVPCGCVMPLELPTGEITDAVAEAAMRRFPNWGWLALNTVARPDGTMEANPQSGFYCSVECMLARNEVAQEVVYWRGAAFRRYTR